MYHHINQPKRDLRKEIWALLIQAPDTLPRMAEKLTHITKHSSRVHNVLNEMERNGEVVQRLGWTWGQGMGQDSPWVLTEKGRGMYD